MERSGLKAALRSLTLALGVAPLLGACAFFDNALLPSLSGGKGTANATAPAGPGAGSQSAAAIPGKPTGTPVGQKIQSLRADLAKLQAAVASQSQTYQTLHTQSVAENQSYHQSVAAINAKLSSGTQPGNPDLLRQWNDAQGQLDKMNAALGPMIKLSNDVSGSASVANYLLNSIRAAYGIAGGVDEDQRQLHALEDEANRTNIEVDRLLSQLTDDIARQTETVSQERANLNTLSFAINSGQPLGASLATRSLTSPTAPPGPPGSGIASGRPFVTIRFDRPNPDYKQALYQAVSQALARRPNAGFDLVAVTPEGGGAAQTALNANQVQRDADEVRRSLISMGISPDRVSLTSATSPIAEVNEVRLYIR
jgi:hypothetical protein